RSCGRSRRRDSSAMNEHQPPHRSSTSPRKPHRQLVQLFMKRDTSVMKSGFVSIVGRPNSGKSTLLNYLVGEKVSIVTKKPQTTRHVVRGIVTRPDGQIVFLIRPASTNRFIG